MQGGRLCLPTSMSSQAVRLFATCTEKLSQGGRSSRPPSTSPLVLFSIAKKRAVTVLAMQNSAHAIWSAVADSFCLRLGLCSKHT